jgi:hypothetical protein
MIETKIESGMEMQITIVGRQSPRKIRIMTAVSDGRDERFAITP